MMEYITSASATVAKSIASGNIGNFVTQFTQLSQGVVNGAAYVATTVTRLASGGFSGIKDIRIQKELNDAGELLIGWANPNYGIFSSSFCIDLCHSVLIVVFYVLITSSSHWLYVGFLHKRFPNIDNLFFYNFS